MKKLSALIIMDGFGIPKPGSINAMSGAHIKYIEELKRKYPNTQINASGRDVGLPDGQMGNSEVGHLNIGAGRIVYQELTRITKDIEDGGFFKNSCFLDAMKNAKDKGSKLHLIGLLSDGGVHSHIEHVFALLRMAKQNGLKNAYVHCLTDGRDVPPTSGRDYITQMQDYMDEIGFGSIATIIGRYYAMDRDNRWERVRRAYGAMVEGKGDLSDDLIEAVNESYANDVSDEFILPIIAAKGGKPVTKIEANDSVIFFNFRPDRAREITRAFIDKDFDSFERANGFFPLHYVCMTQYDKTFKNCSVAYKPETLKNTFGEYLSKLGKTQLRIAETEKYAHVTFFFNGGVEQPNEGEERVLIPSPKVATYDLKPEMSAYEVTDEAVKRIESGKYDVMILNFANPDMVGHTGVLKAATMAVHVVDECVGKVVDTILKNGGKAIVTADHGNADQMVDEDTHVQFTAHTTNPVPFILVDDAFAGAKLRENGRLADVVPTLLDMMHIEKPKEMEGSSLIVHQ